MEGTVSCCGCVCSTCPSYPQECAGCPAMGGRTPGPKSAGGLACEAYRCCAEQKQPCACGLCGEQLCAHCGQDDPAKAPQKAAGEYRRQLEQLRRTAEKEKKGGV